MIIKLFIRVIMKSISLVDSTAIRNHPSNDSASKIAHQFSKTQRFPAYNPQCKIAFYANESQLSNRKTSFGYGQKLDFTKTSIVGPASTTYNLKSQFQINRQKGKSFGLSRQSSPDKSYLVPQMQKMPGPGKYQCKKQFENNIKYSMRRKTIDFIQQKKTNKYNPQPGYYNIDDISTKNKFVVSKYSDVQFAKINPNSQRFQKIKQTPGPLKYQPGEHLSSKGKYILSGHRGNGTRTFSQMARTTFTDQFRKTATKFPGPGSYEKPSDFGVYGDNNYYKTMNGFKTTQK